MSLGRHFVRKNHVDRQTRTSAPDIFGAGDCVETWHRLLQKLTYLPPRSRGHRSGRLLGGQIVGHWQAEVAERIDIFATALFDHLRVGELSDLDLSYTPPLGAPWDAVQEAAGAWVSAAQ